MRVAQGRELRAGADPEDLVVHLEAGVVHWSVFGRPFFADNLACGHGDWNEEEGQKS